MNFGGRSAMSSDAVKQSPRSACSTTCASSGVMFPKFRTRVVVSTSTPFTGADAVRMSLVVRGSMCAM